MKKYLITASLLKVHL